MKIVEYRKHLFNGQVVDPEWIIQGSYFYDRDSDTYMGFVLSSEDRQYYIPDTVEFLTEEEAIFRVLDIHSRYPWIKSKDEGLNKIYKTDKEVKDWVIKVIKEKPHSAEMY